MKYQLQMEINLPRARVIELFDNQDNLHHWQPELKRFTHLSGNPGEVGAKSELIYLMGKREITMIETITLKDLPDRFAGTYETKGMWNSVDNQFIETSPESTLWKFDTEFRCEGVMMRLMAWLMPSSFKKQSLLFMQRFKDFAEAQH
ncbi:SRPBCC family protein [Paraferrimonas sedimenticola]|uniref:SRPBCC family protein n=1 Tax=Paraferrimonas sedimenticola TaxID=375674 RepID=A0AA37RT32_9GAMM|nr:SRPBCC family protein [Paraferrimonas sedimenticola]GLP95013.1 hypothetical protein GCM10007895_03190 [Paraferrimonas sedimenticola]